MNMWSWAEGYVYTTHENDIKTLKTQTHNINGFHEMAIQSYTLSLA